VTTGDEMDYMCTAGKIKMMKNICRGVILLLLGGVIGMGAVHASELPANTSDRVTASVQSLVDAGLPHDQSVEITGVMLENNFNDNQVMSVHHLILEAKAQDLPISPLTGKIIEGVSKKIQSDRIVRAVENVQARQAFSLNQGKRITRDNAKARNMAEAYTASLAAGLTKKDAKSITGVLVQSKSAQDSEDAYALSMATMKTARDMSRLGVNSSILTQVISRALGKGFTADRMESMRQTFIFQAQQTHPDTLAMNFARAIDRGASFGSGSSHSPDNQNSAGQGADPGHSGGDAGDSGSGGGSGTGAGGGSDGSGGSSGSGSGGASGSSGAGSGAGAGSGGGGSPGAGSGN